MKIKTENKKTKAKMLIGIGSGLVVGFIFGRIHENLIVYEKIEDIINGNYEKHIDRSNKIDNFTSKIGEHAFDKIEKVKSKT